MSESIQINFCHVDICDCTLCFIEIASTSPCKMLAGYHVVLLNFGWHLWFYLFFTSKRLLYYLSEKFYNNITLQNITYDKQVDFVKCWQNLITLQKYYNTRLSRSHTIYICAVLLILFYFTKNKCGYVSPDDNDSLMRGIKRLNKVC